MARIISAHEYDLKPGSNPAQFEQALRDAEARDPQLTRAYRRKYMTSWLIGAILSLALVTLSATAPLTQQIRERDTTPFERCKPLTAIASVSNRETLTALQDILTARGFAISAIDLDRGELSAIKRDQNSNDRSDRVLLWLERDPFKPGERAYVYFMYSRFEPFVGSTSGPIRVRMWPNELGRMTALQEAIVAFAVTRQ